MTETARQLQVTAVRESLDHIHAFLEELWSTAPQIAEEERVRFTLATAELAANVVQHGTPDPEGAAPTITLTVEIVGTEIRALLADDGNLPPRRAPSPWQFDNLGDEPPVLRESGRGLHLVRESTDALLHDRDGPFNRWTYNVRPRG